MPNGEMARVCKPIESGNGGAEGEDLGSGYYGLDELSRCTKEPVFSHYTLVRKK